MRSTSNMTGESAVPDNDDLDRGLTGGMEYCHVVTTYTDEDCESAPGHSR